MSLLKSAATVGGFTLMSRVLGFLRDQLIAFTLGTGYVAEAFFVAPNGRDSWSGRLAVPNADGTDGPFATVERARNAL